MRNLYFIIFLFSFFLSNAQNTPSVVASASIFEDMAQHIVGNLYDVERIVPIGGDPHLHTPSPRDAQLVSNADLILVNGLTFEGWINELIENSGTKATVVTITAGISALESTTYKNSADPHAWMDASNGLIYAENIWKALVELDPKNKEVYTKNYEVYKKQIQDLDDFITDEIRKIPLDQRVLITSHDAFAYYGQRYGIRVEALMGVSTEAEAGTNDMIRVNDVIRKNKIPAVFIESTINPKLIKQIATDNKVKIGGELFADSIGDEESEGHGFIEMLRHNTITITKALSNNSDSKLSDTHKHEDSKSNIWLYLLAGFLLIGGLLLTIYKVNQ